MCHGQALHIEAMSATTGRCPGCHQLTAKLVVTFKIQGERVTRRLCSHCMDVLIRELRKTT